jgi:hypothetical protein
LNQSFDASWRQLVSVTAHAILQATRFKPPLTAKPPIILGAFPFAGLSRTGRKKNQSESHQQYRTRIPHQRPPLLLRLRERTFGRDVECGQVKVTVSSTSLPLLIVEAGLQTPPLIIVN